MQIYLASLSPRRKELLTQMQVDFELLKAEIPEEVRPGENPEDYSMRISKEKCINAKRVMIENGLTPRPILCADTESIFNGQILGKANTREEAFNTLKKHSGKTHPVITSVGLIHGDKLDVRLSRTDVTFTTMSDDAINTYLDTGDYVGKAGSYSIQSSIAQYIKQINGCFYSVMGLPLSLVREMLEAI